MPIKQWRGINPIIWQKVVETKLQFRPHAISQIFRTQMLKAKIITAHSHNYVNRFGAKIAINSRKTQRSRGLHFHVICVIFFASQRFIFSLFYKAILLQTPYHFTNFSSVSNAISVYFSQEILGNRSISKNKYIPYSLKSRSNLVTSSLILAPTSTIQYYLY